MPIYNHAFVVAAQVLRQALHSKLNRRATDGQGSWLFAWMAFNMYLG